MRILDRYIFKELLPPFAMGVAMFTAIFMGAALLPELAKLAIKGGGSLEVLWIFLLSIPSVIVVTFPMAMLLSTLLGMGRLSSDSELVAALASGISLRRMAVPVLALATVVAVFDFAFQETVVPSCYREVRDLKLGIRARADAAVEHNILFWVPDPAQGPARLIVGVERIRVRADQGPGTGDQGTLLGVKVVYLDKKGVPEGIAYAEEATYEGEGGSKSGMWRLNRVRYYVLPGGKEGAPQTGEKRAAIEPLHLDEIVLDLGRDPGNVARDEVKAQEMPVGELRQAIRNRMAVGIPASEYEVNLHQRFSVPFAAVVFALIGVPLGLRRQRTGSSLGLGLSVLIIFVYYIVWHYLGTLGKGGAMDPFLAAWIPNIAAAAIGGVLLYRAPN
ncbi:MAG TPA: LptF/LptG family permease [Armatimonadota bacterium]|nr:LptF/LptG family permease [Armatimonadota bacterium]